LLHYPFIRDVKIGTNADLFKSITDHEIIITELNSESLSPLKDSGLKILSYYKSNDLMYFYKGKIKDSTATCDYADYFYIAKKSWMAIFELRMMFTGEFIVI
jgi:hypothetical protein